MTGRNSEPQGSMPGAIIFTANVSKTYPYPVGPVFSSFQLSCTRGEIVALVGPSGCGKSTFMNLLAGLEEGDPGSMVEVRARSLGYAFQQPEHVPWRNTSDAAYLEADILRVPRELIQARIEHLLSVTRLKDSAGLFPDQMSVGMRQRLQLVRVCARPVELLLLDEPLSAVDQPLRVIIAEELRELLKGDRTTVVWVTHDPREAVAVADRVLVLTTKPMLIAAEVHVDRGSASSATPGEPERTASLAGTPGIEAQAAAIRAVVAKQYLQSAPAGVRTRLPSSPDNTIRALRRTLASGVLAAAPVVVLMLIWELVVTARPSLRFFLSSPSEWVPLLVTEARDGDLLVHLSVTLRETLFGLMLGLPVGVALGFLAGLSRQVSSALRPSLAGLTAVPLFVLAPAFILWFGIGESMKIALAAVSCFPFTAYLVHSAIEGARGTYYRYLKRLGARTDQLLIRLLVPYSLEAIFLSLRPATVAALMGAFLGEFVAAQVGLGYYVIYQASRYRIAEVCAGVFLLFLTAGVIDLLGRWFAARRNKLLRFFGI